MLTLLFKIQDRQLITNQRPISITSIDFKIILNISALANMLHTVLPELISHTQTA